jgi:transposase InsO family protein
MKRDAVLTITGVTRHQYYHRPLSGGRRGGRPVSQHTGKRMADGCKHLVPDAEVIAQLHALKADPATDHGYQKTTKLLMMMGYYINPKKVERLMGEQNLLADRRKAPARTYVKYRTVAPERPLEVLEMDIKSAWCTRERRQAYILTILDTFTRQALHHSAALSMTRHQVKAAWDLVIEQHLQPADLLNKGLRVEVRSDNGPQFGARLVQEYFKENQLDQVFTHPYTPQENGHIESFHALLATFLQRHTFWCFEELLAVLPGFYRHYNTRRPHASIAYLWPDLFAQAWHAGLIARRVDQRGRARFKLLIPYQELSGCRSLKGVSCLIPTGSHTIQKVSGPGSLLTPSVTQSPSVVSC